MGLGEKMVVHVKLSKLSNFTPAKDWSRGQNYPVAGA